MTTYTSTFPSSCLTLRVTPLLEQSASGIGRLKILSPTVKNATRTNFVRHSLKMLKVTRGWDVQNSRECFAPYTNNDPRHFDGVPEGLMLSVRFLSFLQQQFPQPFLCEVAAAAAAIPPDSVTRSLALLSARCRSHDLWFSPLGADGSGRFSSIDQGRFMGAIIIIRAKCTATHCRGTQSRKPGHLLGSSWMARAGSVCPAVGL